MMWVYLAATILTSMGLVGCLAVAGDMEAGDDNRILACNIACGLAIVLLFAAIALIQSVE